MPPRDAIATPRGHRCEATCSACVFPDRSQGPPNRVLADPTTLTRPPSHGGEPTLSDATNQTQPLPVGRSDYQQQVNPADFGEGLALSRQCRNLSRSQECSWTQLADTKARAHLYRHQQSALIAGKEINLQPGHSHVALNNDPACGAKAFARQLLRPPPPPLLRRLHACSIAATA